MGNHLVGIAPSQIYPVENYLMGSFESDLQYESSMGSTRFFKVARVRSDEGLIVVKVFVKHDPSLPLETHAERVMFIQKSLSNAVNCLPFQRVQVTEKVALVMREYVKHSLYDRVSTRPFLTSLEKKWITFQVLCALHQCHKQKICHGDIKLENILITSWNWILLSDFASFKPTYLPEDNPADYTYFFDTSRRRTCYVAPERFVKSFSSDANSGKNILIGGSSLLSASIMDGMQQNDQSNTTQLLPEMDIFSAGCALLELWSEGSAPFELSQLLAYRSGDMELVTKHLDQLENENLRNLIASMISRIPSDRKSAEVYLDEERGRLFPEYFYTFLQSYMQMFSSLQILPADEKIMRLYSDIKQIIDIFLPQTDEIYPTERNIPNDDGLILITAVVTSCIRGLKYCKSKLHCLEILQQLSMYTTAETVLDRILPYILHLCNDPAARVRVSALDTLTMCLRLVKDPPRNDANIFPEYVLPSIQPLANDSSVVVRIAYARNVADIAETAVYFLDQTQLASNQELPVRYESELSALHEMLHQTVSHLLTDQQAIVKQTVMECGITKLCVFFGRQKANDLILSHMITFLNDKEDKSLRGSFFDCIVGVAAFVGWQCSDILLPLLQQGLTDPEEFVIAKAIRATTALTGLGLIQKPALSEFISECACYLNHPNLWIRHEVCGLIADAAKVFGAIDIQCKIMPAIINHLKCPLIQVEKPEILMDCLQIQIPRNIFDSVVKFTELEAFFTLLEERKKARESTIETLPHHNEMTPNVRNFFRRISCEGLTELAEKQILSMKSSISKLNKYLRKAPSADKYSTKEATNGKIFIDSKIDIGKELILVDSKKQPLTNRKSDAETVNADWQRMFSHSDKSSASPMSDYISAGVSSTHFSDTPSTSLVEYSMPEKNFIQERTSDCRNELNGLHNKLKTQYTILSINSDSNAVLKRASLPPGHTIKGSLIAHLHEHKSSVTKLAALSSSSSLFASASTDGTVRLFDCNKLNGLQIINKSRQMYSANVPIYSIAACDSGQSLAVAGNDGSLLLLRIDPNSSKMALQQARHLVQNSGGYNGFDDGPVVDMHPLDHDSQSVIIYATLYGAIVCWDLRMPNNAWRLNSDLKQGIITTFCIDSNVSWLATGTSGGNHICYDLRFKLPIAKIQHPSATRIRKVIPHPTESSWLISSSHGNNEVSIWNIETGHRQAALWASNAPPLSKEISKNVSSVCGLVPCIVDRSPVLFSGSSDQRIRYWDLNARGNCSMVVAASRDHTSGTSFSYDSRLIDGTRVIYEVQTNNKSNSASTGMANTMKSDDYSPRSGPEVPLPCHNDVITDMLMCRTQKYPVLVSSSRDGVIKLWK